MALEISGTSVELGDLASAISIIAAFVGWNISRAKERAEDKAELRKQSIKTVVSKFKDLTPLTIELLNALNNQDTDKGTLIMPQIQKHILVFSVESATSSDIVDDIIQLNNDFNLGMKKEDPTFICYSIIHAQYILNKKLMDENTSINTAENFIESIYQSIFKIEDIEKAYKAYLRS